MSASLPQKERDERKRKEAKRKAKEAKVEKEMESSKSKWKSFASKVRPDGGAGASVQAPCSRAALRRASPVFCFFLFFFFCLPTFAAHLKSAKKRGGLGSGKKGSSIFATPDNPYAKVRIRLD